MLNRVDSVCNCTYNRDLKGVISSMATTNINVRVDSVSKTGSESSKSTNVMGLSMIFDIDLTKLETSTFYANQRRK